MNRDGFREVDILSLLFILFGPVIKDNKGRGVHS